MSTGTSYTMPLMGQNSLPSIQLDSIRNAHKFRGDIEFVLTSAEGGTIVSVGNSGFGEQPTLYIIPDDRDLGTELTKIITLTCLKRENR